MIVQLVMIVAGAHVRALAHGHGPNRLPSLEVRNSYRALSNFTLAMFILEFFVEVVARGAWFPAKTAHLRSPLRRLDDYTGPELAHSAELDYQGADDLPELLPREAGQTPAPRGFARPGDLSAGGGVV